MIWVQALVCFVVWLAYGVYMRRSSERLRVSMQGRSRQYRTMLGSVGLLAGLGVLALGLFWVYRSGGLTEDGLKPWAWFSVAVTGLVFVHLQIIGAAAMLSLVLDGVTDRRRGPSVNEEKEPQ